MSVHDLVYDRRGSGPPLVLIHGLGSHWRVWLPVLDRLAAEREVVALDLPGFGDSPPLPDGRPHGVASLTDVVAAFVGGLGLDRPHVAGNSLGGGIALELARRGSVRSATALSPIGFASPGEMTYASASLQVSRRLTRALRPAAPRLVRSTALRTALFGQVFGRPWRLAPEEALANVQALDEARGFDEALADGRRYQFQDGDALRAPVTVAWGTRDRLLLPRQAERARRRLPQARHVWLAWCGHVPMTDDPEQVTEVLLTGSAS